MRDWRLLLSHNHYLTIKIGRHEARLCARCSGTVLGYFSSQLLQPFTYSIGFGSLNPLLQVVLAFSLALPSGIDWLTQTWGFRLSTNRTRFLVGLLIGIGAGLLGLSSQPSLTKLLILAYSSLGVVSIGYLGRRFTRPVNPSPPQIPNP
jgi:uncharacterized membrane protein